MTTTSQIQAEINVRFNELKKIAITEHRGDENIMLAAGLSEGPFHTVSIPCGDFFKSSEGFDFDFWEEEAARVFSGEPKPKVIGIGVPISFFREDESTIEFVGVACVHRWGMKIGGYIAVGDEYMWEENFNHQMMLPFMTAMRRQLAQYG